MRKIAWNRKTVSITLAAVIIPVSLLVALALNSMSLHQALEIVNVDAVSWSMNRPSNDTIIDEYVKNFYNDTCVAVLEIHMYRYLEDDPHYSDCIGFMLNVTAEVTEGFIDYVVIRYQVNPTSSNVGLDPNGFALRNLKMENIEYYANYVTAVGVNQPKNCSLKHWNYWTMGYDNDVEQAVKVTAEILCFNGTAYQEIHIPIDLFVHAV